MCVRRDKFFVGEIFFLHIMTNAEILHNSASNNFNDDDGENVYFQVQSLEKLHVNLIRHKRSLLSVISNGGNFFYVHEEIWNAVKSAFLWAIKALVIHPAKHKDVSIGYDIQSSMKNIA